MSRRFFGLAISLGAVLGESGCSAYQTYAGPKRPDRIVGLLDVPVAVESVDGEAVADPGARRLAVLPGWHEVRWSFVYPNGFTETRELSFVARQGERYRLGQRFFPDPHPAGALGEVFDVTVDTLLLPLRLLFPQAAPEGPSPGEYYCWIVERRTQRVVAGSAPDVPMPHETITYVPVDTTGGTVTAGAPDE
jgi:hypothetical protein